VGFLLFHILEKGILMHYDHANHYSPHRHPYVGVASALALIGHSFLDGVGIGLGFQAGETIGIAVAIAVIAHDFADGLNTVSLMMSSRNSSRRSVIFLVFDALAPIAGIVVGQMIHLDPIQLVVYLGFFTGFLLYIGASDILPQAHEKGTSRLTIGMTVAGVVLMYIVTQLSH
jgi:zinc transporter ZupT